MQEVIDNMIARMLLMNHTDPQVRVWTDNERPNPWRVAMVTGRDFMRGGSAGFDGTALDLALALVVLLGSLSDVPLDGVIQEVPRRN